MIYLGIDPGANGGIACLSDTEEGVHCSCIPIPKTESETWERIEEIRSNAVLGDINVTAAIEQQTPRPSNIFDRTTGKWRATILASTCLLYGNYKLLTGMLTAAKIPFEEVPPKRWQEGLKIPKKEKIEKDNVWKNRLKAKASKLFPSVKITLQTADAILLAEYLRRWRTGTL